MRDRFDGDNGVESVPRVFTQLIRDSQFSTLGLGLIAELAEIRQSVEAVATQRHVLVSQVPACHTPNTERDPHSRPGEDVGEAVCRPPPAAFVSTSLVPSPEEPPCPQKAQDDAPSPISITGGKDLETAIDCSTVTTKSSTRRKQKSRNPIDDLFSRLDWVRHLESSPLTDARRFSATKCKDRCTTAFKSGIFMYSPISRLC